MMRGGTIVWAALALVAGTGLFMLKYQVQAEEHHLSALKKDIVNAEESIHVLKAEWSYLNEPQRLRDQAERHLALHTMKPSQIASIAGLPMADRRPVAVAEAQMPAEIPPAPVAQSVPAAPIPAARTDVAKVPAASPAPAPVAATERRTPPPQPAKPGRTQTASAAHDAHINAHKVVPAHKESPAVKETRTAKASPPAPRAVMPVYASATVRPLAEPSVPRIETTRSVMVITSPAAVQAEMASAQVRP